MQPNAVYALLHDSSGSILLARRRGTVLWGLPGGEVRSTTPLSELLGTYCARQVGMAPDFVAAFAEFTLAGKRIAVGVDQIPTARAAARGRVEAVCWMNPGKIPGEIDPVARMAIALFKDKMNIALPTKEQFPALVTFNSLATVGGPQLTAPTPRPLPHHPLD